MEDLSNMSNTMRAAAAQEIRGTPSAQAWFAGGERVGYDHELAPPQRPTRR